MSSTEAKAVLSPERRPGLTRRKVVKSTLAAAGLAAISRWVNTDTVSEEETLEYTRGIFLANPPRAIDWVPVQVETSQLAIEGNARLTQWPGTKSKAAIAVTHPGYMETVYRAVYNGLEQPRDAKKIWGTSSDVCRAFADLAIKHGSQMDAHTANMVRLLQVLPAAAYPSFVYLEHAVQSGEARLPADLVPPPGIMTIATETASGRPYDMISTPSIYPGITRQQPELVYDRLRESGVTTVFAAGEFAYNPDASAACLGVTTQELLNAGFEVRGITGAVFPFEPPRVNNDRDMFKALYDNQVPLAEVIG